MTTVKKILPFIIILLFAAVCLSACGDKDGSAESDDALSMLLEIVGSEESTAVTEYYVVVIPADCSSELSVRAATLADKIEEMTGVESVVEYDNGDNPRRDNAIEIMLGNTARNASRVALAELRSGDYLCKKIDGAIVIGGLSDASTIAALDKFENEILPYADAAQLMSSSAEFEHLAEYKLDKVSLCGYAVRDFYIACDLDNDLLKSCAEEIRQRILADSGYTLKIKDEPKGEKGSKEIILTLQSSAPDANGRILYDGEDVTLCADNVYALEAAVHGLCSILLDDDGSDLICNSTDWSERVIECRNSKLTVAQVVFDATDPDFFALDLVSGVVGELRSSEPHVLVIGKLTAQAWEDVKTNLPTAYGFEAFVQGDLVGAAIYRKSEIDLALNATSVNGAFVAEISFGEKNAEFDYDMTCIFTNAALGSSDAREMIGEHRSDIVMMDFSVIDSGSVVPSDARSAFELRATNGLCGAAACFNGNLDMTDSTSKMLSGNGSELRFTAVWSSCAFSRTSYKS